jgi:hypothetical protein
MASGSKRWTKASDVDRYIRDLEDVYAIKVAMRIQPKPWLAGGNRGTVTMDVWWADSEDDHAPFITYSQEILVQPVDAYIKTMINALVQLTYQCIEAYITAHERLN